MLPGSEEKALAKIRDYLRAGHTLEAIKDIGWEDWIAHFEDKGVTLAAAEPPIQTPRVSYGAEPTEEAETLNRQQSSLEGVKASVSARPATPAPLTPNRNYATRRRRNYGNRRGSTYVDWAAWHQGNREDVGRMFGGIDADVIAAFFNLSPEQFETVLEMYGERYSQKAADYARFAFPKWRSGERGMAGETLERLLEVVPYVLSLETKMDLYRKVRTSYRELETLTLQVEKVEDIALVHQMVNRIVARAEAQPIPEHVDMRLVWLSEGDGLVARKLVAASEEAEGAALAEALRNEMDGLHRFFLSTLDVGHTMTHVVSLPCGTVTVEFARRKKRRWLFMSSDEEQPQSNLPARREDRPAKDIFEFALQNMVNPEDSQEIVLAAQKEHLRLMAKEKEGEIDGDNAQKDLQDFIDKMRDLERSGMEFSSDADFKRASGTTHLSVKKKKRFFFF